MMAEANTKNSDSKTHNGEDAAGTRAAAAGKISDARDAASEYAHRAAEVVESNPVAVVAGGLVAGIVAGALIPRSDREREALAPLGKKIADGAQAAVQAARETGKAQLTASLLSPDAAKESARAVFDSAVQAVKGGEQQQGNAQAQGSQQASSQQGTGGQQEDASQSDQPSGAQARSETTA